VCRSRRYRLGKEKRNPMTRFVQRCARVAKRRPSAEFRSIPAALYHRRSKSGCNVPYRSWTNCLKDIYSLLYSARATLFLLRVSLNTVFRCVRNAKRKNQMRSASKTTILRACLRSMVENGPLITAWRPKATKAATMGVSVSQQLVRVVLKSPG